MEVTRAVPVKRLRRWRITIQSILFALTGLNVAVGLLLGPEVAIVTAFGLSLIFLIWGRALSGALGLLWMVRFEPAPADVLFAWSWVRLLIRARFSRVLLWCFAPLSAFLIFNFIQLAWAVELSRAVFFFAATAYVALILVVLGSIKDRQAYLEARRWYLWAVHINTAIVIILGMAYIVGLGSYISGLYYGNRPKAFFKDPNVAGAFAVTGVLFGLSNVLFSSTMKAGLVTMMLSIAAVILSFSRGALIGLVAGAVSLGVIAMLLRRAARLVLAVTSALILAFPVLWAGLERFNQGSRFQGLTEYDVIGRLAAWVTGLKVFSEAPWGIGPGQFEPKVATLFEYYSAHNTFLRLLVENGVLGILLMGTAVTVILLTGVVALRVAIRLRSAELIVDCAWLISCLIAILSEGMVIDALHWRHFWVLAGFIIANYRIIRQMIWIITHQSSNSALERDG